MKTSEWPALHAVWEEKKQIIVDREVEHAQHVIEHGAPRTRPDIWLAALVLMKANRIWNNLVRGGTADALRDSVLDLSNYSDFLAALLGDTQFAEAMEVLGCPPEKGDPVERLKDECAFPIDEILLKTTPAHVVGVKRCSACMYPLTKADWVYMASTDQYYCPVHVPIEHK